MAERKIFGQRSYRVAPLRPSLSLPNMISMRLWLLYLKAHRTATSMMAQKEGRGRLIGRTKGGMNTKLHAICDSKGRPIDLFVTAGQVNDYVGARALLSSLPNVKWLLEDRGYDADWFREALQDKGIACKGDLLPKAD